MSNPPAARRGRNWPGALLRLAAHLACLLPFALWTRAAWQAELGADPIAALTHASGDWALRFLLASLAISPLRRLSQWRWPLQYRRMQIGRAHV